MLTSSRGGGVNLSRYTVGQPRCGLWPLWLAEARCYTAVNVVGANMDEGGGAGSGGGGQQPASGAGGWGGAGDAPLPPIFGNANAEPGYEFKVCCVTTSCCHSCGGIV